MILRTAWLSMWCLPNASPVRLARRQKARCQIFRHIRLLGQQAETGEGLLDRRDGVRREGSVALHRRHDEVVLLVLNRWREMRDSLSDRDRFGFVIEHEVDRL